MSTDSEKSVEGSSLRIPGGLPSTSGFLRHSGGDLVVEFYDFSETAESWFGNDVAILYTVREADLPALKSALEATQSTASSGQSLVESLAVAFSSVMALIDWIKASGVPYSKSFDSQA